MERSRPKPDSSTRRRVPSAGAAQRSGAESRVVQLVVDGDPTKQWLEDLMRADPDVAASLDDRTESEQYDAGHEVTVAEGPALGEDLEAWLRQTGGIRPD